MLIRKYMFEEILSKLPFAEPFLYVDGLTALDMDKIEGFYTFNPESDFYRGHFIGNPVTPGVLLTECCAQIGLVCLGIYLNGETTERSGKDCKIALVESDMHFILPVYPGERVTVTGTKIYFRFGKLKVGVSLYNAEGKLACKGVMAGMIKSIDR